jgi:hypothetical protein
MGCLTSESVMRNPAVGIACPGRDAARAQAQGCIIIALRSTLRCARDTNESPGRTDLHVWPNPGRLFRTVLNNKKYQLRRVGRGVGVSRLIPAGVPARGTTLASGGSVPASLPAREHRPGRRWSGAFWPNEPDDHGAGRRPWPWSTNLRLARQQDRYCLGIPARSITAAHLAISAVSRALSSSGVLALASIPKSA